MAKNQKTTYDKISNFIHKYIPNIHLNVVARNGNLSVSYWDVRGILSFDFPDDTEETLKDKLALSEHHYRETPLDMSMVFSPASDESGVRIPIDALIKAMDGWVKLNKLRKSIVTSSGVRYYPSFALAFDSENSDDWVIFGINSVAPYIIHSNGFSYDYPEFLVRDTVYVIHDVTVDFSLMSNSYSSSINAHYLRHDSSNTFPRAFKRVLSLFKQLGDTHVRINVGSDAVTGQTLIDVFGEVSNTHLTSSFNWYNVGTMKSLGGSTVEEPTKQEIKQIGNKIFTKNFVKVSEQLASIVANKNHKVYFSVKLLSGNLKKSFADFRKTIPSFSKDSFVPTFVFTNGEDVLFDARPYKYGMSNKYSPIVVSPYQFVRISEYYGTVVDTSDGITLTHENSIMVNAHIFQLSEAIFSGKPTDTKLSVVKDLDKKSFLVLKIYADYGGFTVHNIIMYASFDFE